jgi:hypothetical protein
MDNSTQCDAAYIMLWPLLLLWAVCNTYHEILICINYRDTPNYCRTTHGVYEGNSENKFRLFQATNVGVGESSRMRGSVM